MILTVAELRQYIETDESDSMLSMKLQAIENMIRAYTHNNFQNRNIRCVCNAVDGVLECTSSLLSVGDTIELSNSGFNGGIYTIVSIDSQNGCIRLSEALNDESDILLTKVEYPEDIKEGTVNLMKWDLDMRDKVGIQSETTARHSVTYYDQSGNNAVNGYPVALIGFLTPYKKMKGWD